MIRTDRRRVAWSTGQIALLPAAAFAVHQLRYLLAYGSAAGVELQRQGHSYLHSVVPWLVLLIALGVGAFLRALGRAFSGQTSRSRYTVSFAGLWLACAVGLVCIYVCQESLEGLFATGHPGGWVGIFGSGGWWSIPAATCVGLVLAAVLHGARWVLSEVASRCSRARARGRLQIRACLRRAFEASPGVVPLVDGWSDRGPPA